MGSGPAHDVKPRSGHGSSVGKPRKTSRLRVRSARRTHRSPRVGERWDTFPQVTYLSLHWRACPNWLWFFLAPPQRLGVDQVHHFERVAVSPHMHPPMLSFQARLPPASFRPLAGNSRAPSRAARNRETLSIREAPEGSPVQTSSPESPTVRGLDGSFPKQVDLNRKSVIMLGSTVLRDPRDLSPPGAGGG